MRLHHRSSVVGVLVGALLLPAAAQAAVYPGPHGPRDVRGAIEQEWLRIGGARSVVGAPLISETPTPSRTGAFNHFERGSIYWSPGTGAHEVHGAILGTWTATGWENGPLGFPTTNEMRTPNGLGAYNHFQGGSIYWSPATGAREVHGLIRQAWAATGWEGGALGFPTTSETRTPNGVGAYNHFQGGSVYWSPATGAQVVTGDIRDRYLALGAESSALGLPIGPRRAGTVAGATWQQFQNGVLYSAPPYGVHVVQGAIAQVWLAQGGDASSFGAPQTSEYDDWDVRRSDFSYGSLIWSRTRGVYTGYRDYRGEQSAVLPIAKLNEPMVAQVVTTGTATITATAAGSTDPQVVVVPGHSAGAIHVPMDFGDRRSSRQRTQFVVDQPVPGSYSIRLMPMNTVPSFDGALYSAGGGIDVQRYVGPARTAHIVASAPGAAISVTAYDGATNPLGTLASGTGSVDVTVPLATNTHLFIQCDGPWSITFP